MRIFLQILISFMSIFPREKFHIFSEYNKNMNREIKHVANYLLKIGFNFGKRGYHFVTLHCFEVAEKVVKSEDLMKVIA